MKRHGIGRGRLIIAAGAIVVAVGSFGTWWTLGGTVTPRLSGNAFDGVGALCFFAAILLIALVLLPYATRTGEAGLDRKLTYVVLATIAVAAFVMRAIDIHAFAGIGLPQQVPGLWGTGVGLAIVAWGVAELFGERPRSEWQR